MTKETKRITKTTIKKLTALLLSVMMILSAFVAVQGFDEQDQQQPMNETLYSSEELIWMSDYAYSDIFEKEFINEAFIRDDTLGEDLYLEVWEYFADDADDISSIIEFEYLEVDDMDIDLSEFSEIMNLPSVLPVVNGNWSNLTSTSVELFGTILNTGGTPVTAHGFWIRRAVDVNGPLDEFWWSGSPFQFGARITGLQPNTQYIARAVARNGSGVGQSSQIIFTTLPPSLLSISPTTNWNNIPAAGGAQRTINVTTDAPTYSVQRPAWLDLNFLTGGARGFTLTATQNPWASTRTGTVTVVAGNLQRTFTVTQLPAAPTLSISPTTNWNNIPAAGGAQRTITVTTNTPTITVWRPDWLYVEQVPVGFRLTAAQNPWASTRTGTVTVVAGNQERSFTVSQLPGSAPVPTPTPTPGPTLDLNPASTTVNNANLSRTITIGGSATGTISTNRGPTLPLAVQLATPVNNTITITGTRPAPGQPPITGTHNVTVTRGGVSQTLAVEVNLTAMPMPQMSNIIFDANGGRFGANQSSPTTVTIPVAVGSQIGAPPPNDPVAAGREFIGWFTQPNGGRPFSPTDIATHGGLTYYAQWRVVTNVEMHYRVLTNDSGGTALFAQSLATMDTVKPSFADVLGVNLIRHTGERLESLNQMDNRRGSCVHSNTDMCTAWCGELIPYDGHPMGLRPRFLDGSDCATYPHHRSGDLLIAVGEHPTLNTFRFVDFAICSFRPSGVHIGVHGLATMNNRTNGRTIVTNAPGINDEIVIAHEISHLLGARDPDPPGTENGIFCTPNMPCVMYGRLDRNHDDWCNRCINDIVSRH